MGLFGDHATITIIPPTHSYPGGPSPAEIDGLRELIERERAEFEVEFGAPVTISDSPSSNGPLVLIGPAGANPWFSRAGVDSSQRPAVRLDSKREILIIDGVELSEIVESLSLLRTLTSTDATDVVATECRDISETVARVQQEVRFTYPAFGLRGIDWDQVCERHVDNVLNAEKEFTALQRWVAELQDMHTWVRPDPPDGLLPYMLHVSPDEARFWRVPEWSAGYEAGVRPGDRLTDVDTLDLWERTGGPPHMRPFLAGRRLLSGEAGALRTFTVGTQSGSEIEFDDSPMYQPWPEPVTWSRLESGTAYIRLFGFPPGTNDAIDAAFRDLRGCNRLIIDLRRNSGGLLVEALNLRDRFIDLPTRMGSIRYSTPEGGLSSHIPIDAVPAPESQRWMGPVRFLTDPLTASASEDALLGLQGLPNVRTVGTSTGGGSGRPRSLRLLPGMRLSVSTALTFDRKGHCIEGAGIPADIRIPMSLADPDVKTLQAADRSW